MSDYYSEVELSRDDMIAMLDSNSEQFVYVVAGSVGTYSADALIEDGTLPHLPNKDVVVKNLRRIADAIENGEIS